MRGSRIKNVEAGIIEWEIIDRMFAGEETSKNRQCRQRNDRDKPDECK